MCSLPQYESNKKFNPVWCNGCKYPYHVLNKIDKLIEDAKCGSVDCLKPNLTEQDYNDGGALIGIARKQFFIIGSSSKENVSEKIPLL